MARMFTTEFAYKQEVYTATVIIKGIDGGKTIEVELPEALYKIVPGGKMTISPVRDIPKLENGLSKDPALVSSVLAAVEKHEQTEAPRGLWN